MCETTLRQLFSVKTTKKAVRLMCEAATSQGLLVEHRIKGDIDNIYINNQLVAVTSPYYTTVVTEVTYKLSDLVR